MSELTEDRVREIVREELAHVEAANTGAGHAQPPQGDPLAPRIDAEQPRGTPGTTWVPSLAKNLPNAIVDSQGRPEGPYNYGQRVSMILADGDASKAGYFVQASAALLTMQSASYGFAGVATYPEAIARAWRQVMVDPVGQGTVGR